MQPITVHFYLGYQKQPRFGPAGFENAFIFCMHKWYVATELYRWFDPKLGVT
jgi:hypothetical protein